MQSDVNNHGLMLILNYIHQRMNLNKAGSSFVDHTALLHHLLEVIPAEEHTKRLAVVPFGGNCAGFM